jgi:protein SCO1
VRSALRRAGVAAATGLLLAGCSSAPADEGGEQSLHGTALGNPFEAPTTELQSTDGEPYALAEGTEKPLTLLFFGYTYCPDICQMVMSNIASGLTRLDDGVRDQVEVVFVTTDPARDDAGTLRDYLDRFDPSFVGLREELDTVVAVGEKLGVYIDKGERLPSGGFDVAHTDHVFAIDADDEVPVIWDRETSAAEFADDITLLLEDAS